MEIDRKRNKIPNYHFHTKSSVHKVLNCNNKSHKKRIKRVGNLQEIITDDNQQSIRQLQEIEQIEKNIGEIHMIEAVREDQTKAALKDELEEKDRMTVIE